MPKALILDLDGTLIDTVYAHVFAWQRALGEAGIFADGWRIHRRVGMGVAEFVHEHARDAGRAVTDDEIAALRRRWGELYSELLPVPRPLPGAADLLAHLRRERIPHGIATAAHRPAIDASLDALGVAPDTVLVQGNEVSRGKPEPDLFLLCAERLGVAPGDCAVACDGLLDLVAARRAGMHPVGVLSGGQPEEELLRAGAERVLRDPEHLLGELPGLGFCAD